MDTKTSNVFSNWEICLKSKFTSKISRDPISTIINNVSNFIYCDLEEPIKLKTNKGYKYYITFLNYYTKYQGVNLLITRLELIILVQAFINRAKV